MEIEIKEIISTHNAGEVAKKLETAMARLLPQLSDRGFQPSVSYLQKMLESRTCILFVAEDPNLATNNIVGSLTLIFYSTPTGKKARIEDVVVDESRRREGIGEKLNSAAIQKARELGAAFVDLTSRPARPAANVLYQKLGFEIQDTNVYRKQLK